MFDCKQPAVRGAGCDEWERQPCDARTASAVAAYQFVSLPQDWQQHREGGLPVDAHREELFCIVSINLILLCFPEGHVTNCMLTGSQGCSVAASGSARQADLPGRAGAAPILRHVGVVRLPGPTEVMVAESGAALIQIWETPGPVSPHRAGQHPNVTVVVVLLGGLSAIQLFISVALDGV